MDRKYEPRPFSDILREACALVGQELPYCIFRGNCEHFVNELRYGKAMSQQILKVQWRVKPNMAHRYDETPQLGDLIEIFRGPYQHWAVYVGNGLVVHLTAPSNNTEVPRCSGSMTSVLIDRAVVRIAYLEDVVRADPWKINNGLDQRYKPRPVFDIVREACALIGQEVQYCIFTGNCEHFAKALRYGKAMSLQVLRAVIFAPLHTLVLFGISLAAPLIRRSIKN